MADAGCFSNEPNEFHAQNAGIWGFSYEDLLRTWNRGAFKCRMSVYPINGKYEVFSAEYETEAPVLIPAALSNEPSEMRRAKRKLSLHNAVEVYLPGVYDLDEDEWENDFNQLCDSLYQINNKRQRVQLGEQQVILRPRGGVHAAAHRQA